MFLCLCVFIGGVRGWITRNVESLSNFSQRPRESPPRPRHAYHIRTRRDSQDDFMIQREKMIWSERVKLNAAQCHFNRKNSETSQFHSHHRSLLMTMTIFDAAATRHSSMKKSKIMKWIKVIAICNGHFQYQQRVGWNSLEKRFSCATFKFQWSLD